MNADLLELNKKITKCNKCKRLVNYRKKISIKKRLKNKDEIYWGKPVAGFGDIKANILILGLAPAAHGGTRTGRVFTGDKSGDFLFKSLHAAKISNQPTSQHINDGLKLNKTYITNILKCVPPGDKPSKKELNNCSNYFDYEISYLKNLQIILALGKVAFENCIKYYKEKYKDKKKYTFKHGNHYRLPDGKTIFASYHPSPRNVNTKIINIKMMKNLLLKINKLN